MSIESDKIAFSSELMLAGWQQNHTAGAKVTFWVRDEDLEIFRHMTCKKGNTAGQRFYAVLVELNDDDTPKPQDIDKPRTPLFTSAVMLCKDSTFQRFTDAVCGPIGANTAEERASLHIKEFCKIGSRKELDSSREASMLFSRLMGIYREWRDGNAA